jgi:hypothetical protein
MTVKRIRIDRRGTRRESPWLEDLPARGRAARPPGLASPGLAGVLDERRQLLPEGLGVLGGQIDLILRPAEGEVDGLIGGAATEVVFQRDDYSLCHFNLHNGTGVVAPVPARHDRPPLGTDFPNENGAVFALAVSYITTSGLAPGDVDLVTLESAVPLLAAGLFLQAQFSVSLHSPRTTYYLTVLGGLLISLAIIATTLPLLSRITGPETARHE